MRFVAPLALAISLSACGLTPEGDLAREYVRDRGADAADAALQNSLWVVCNAVPVGAIRREFGSDDDLMAAYNKLCSARQGRVVLRP